MEGKTLKTGKFWDDSGKRHAQERSTSGPWSEHDDGEELGDDDAPDCNLVGLYSLYTLQL